MANVKFTEFPSAATVGSTDIIPIVQGGVNKKATVSVFSTYIGSGFVPYVGATTDLNLDTHDLYTAKVWLKDVPNDAFGSLELTDGVLHFEDGDGHSMVTMEDGYLTIANASTIRALLDVSALSANRDFAFPNASGTLALTSQLSSYLPLAGGTLTGALNGTSASFSQKVQVKGSTAPASGSGLELFYDGSYAGILGYNRTTPGYLPIAIDGSSVTIFTGSTARITTTSAGNVGIGTTSPARRLSVASDGTNWISGIIGGSGGTDVVVMGNFSNVPSIGGHNSTLTAWANLSLNPDGGNVGIGTTTPLAILDVFQTGQPQLRVRGTAGANHLYQDSITGTTTGDGLFVGIGTDQIGYIYHYENKNLVFGTNNSVRLTIKGSGVINISNIPTSAAGLSAGDIWSNLGILTIV